MEHGLSSSGSWAKGLDVALFAWPSSSDGPLLLFPANDLDGRARAAVRDARAKRALDVCGSAALLILLAPLLAAVALAVRFSSPGPVLFRQDRYGRDARVFRIYKFRTMRGSVACAAAIGDPHDHAARVTGVGAWLRRYCIDELPQLINVVAGDMSLVGPRAHPVDLHVAGRLYEAILPDYHRRHAVRPGMTGLAQVMGWCGIVDTVAHAEKRLMFDVTYIDIRSMRLDLALILFTAWRFLVRGGRGAAAFPLGRFLPMQAALRESRDRPRGAGVPWSLVGRAGHAAWTPETGRRGYTVERRIRRLPDRAPDAALPVTTGRTRKR